MERTTIPSFVQDTPDSAGLGEGEGFQIGVGDKSNFSIIFLEFRYIYNISNDTLQSLTC